MFLIGKERPGSISFGAGSGRHSSQKADELSSVRYDVVVWQQFWLG
jgi:hypothetical protein